MNLLRKKLKIMKLNQIQKFSRKKPNLFGLTLDFLVKIKKHNNLKKLKHMKKSFKSNKKNH